MYYFHLFLISSVYTRSLPFLSFIVYFFGQNIPLISPIFLKRSLVFLFCCFLLVLYTVWRRASCLSVLFFWKSAISWIYLFLSPLFFTSLLPLAICKGSSDNYFAFLFFFCFGMVLFAASYTIYGPPCIILHAHCLQFLSPWIYWLPALHIHRGFDLSHTWMD